MHPVGAAERAEPHDGVQPELLGPDGRATGAAQREGVARHVSLTQQRYRALVYRGHGVGASLCREPEAQVAAERPAQVEPTLQLALYLESLTCRNEVEHVEDVTHKQVVLVGQEKQRAGLTERHRVVPGDSGSRDHQPPVRNHYVPEGVDAHRGGPPVRLRHLVSLRALRHGLSVEASARDERGGQ